MVDFFFVLSGFVIFHTYGHALRSWRDVARFMLLRFGRLYPVYLVFLCAFVGLEVAKYIAAEHFGVNFPNGAPFSTNDAWALVENVTMIQALGFTADAESFNYPSWSISTEFYTYLLFAIAALFFAQRWLLVAALLMVLVCVGALWVIDSYPSDARWILRCIAGFFSGCLVYSAYRRFQSVQLHPVAVVLPLIVLPVYLQVTDHTLRSDLLMIPLSAAVIFVLVTSDDGLPAHLLKKGMLQWLGRISYSLYMAHATVIVIVTLSFRLLLDNPRVIQNGASVPVVTLSGWACWAAYLGTVAAALLLAWASFVLIENPGRLKSRDLVARLLPPNP